MRKQQEEHTAPHVSSAEVVQTATEDAVDQFCWTVAQTLKRILDLESSRADNMDLNS
jgi:hypothetical protein